MPATIYAGKTSSISIPILRRALNAALLRIRASEAWLEISLVGRRRIQQLNQRYLKRAEVTDVLSFPIESRRPPRGALWHLGEIVIATPVARIQAKQAKRREIDQVIRLAVHGLVHLLGYDHALGPLQRKRFEREERKILNDLQRRSRMKWDGSLLF